MFGLLRKYPTLSSLCVIGLILSAWAYIPPMFDSPKEALFRAYRECGWAVKINVSVEPKCSWLVNKIKENEPISDSAYAGRLWMQVAEYQLVKGNVNESKSACRKVIESYNLVNVDMDLISNKRTSLEICQALFKKYGP